MKDDIINLDEKLVFCPAYCLDAYRQHMKKRKIEFREKKIDGEVCFVVNRRHRPHAWKIVGVDF